MGDELLNPVVPPAAGEPGTTNPPVTSSTGEETPSPKPSGGETPVGKEQTKSYTEGELQNIIHERTKTYSERIDGYEKKLQELEAKVGSFSPKPSEEAPKGPELDADDKAFVEYLHKVYPQLAVLEKISPEMLQQINSYTGREQVVNEDFLSKAAQSVGKYVTEMGLKEENAVAYLKDLVSAAILNTPKLLKKWEIRDVGVIDEAFKVIETDFGKKKADAEIKKMTEVKAKTDALSNPLPGGGIPAPVGSNKLTDVERVEQAFKSLHGG